MAEIKDEDILEVFNLGEKNKEDKVLHGVIKKEGKIIVVYERNEFGIYTGFLERSILDLSKLNDNQIDFLRKKGYSI